MFKKAIIAIVIVLGLGYFASQQYEKSQHRTKVHEIENSLFPMVVRLPPVQGSQCRPSLIDMSKERVTLVCESLSVEQASAKEELRLALNETMKQWASERPYKDHYLEVRFLDEYTPESKK